jgi:hypothetical protein
MYGPGTRGIFFHRKGLPKVLNIALILKRFFDQKDSARFAVFKFWCYQISCQLYILGVHSNLDGKWDGIKPSGSTGSGGLDDCRTGIWRI